MIFMGTPAFAVPVMLEIRSSGYAIVAAYTRAPARGGGRGLRIVKSPVHVAAETLAIPIITPTTLRTPEFAGSLSRFGAGCHRRRCIWSLVADTDP